MEERISLRPQISICPNLKEGLGLFEYWICFISVGVCSMKNKIIQLRVMYYFASNHGKITGYVEFGH